MKSYWFAAITAVALLSAGAANANEDLAKKSACMACHKIEGKLVGPGYKDVAKKYAGDAGAEAMLIAKVKAGGSGVWGAIPMPPNAAISEADIKTLVKWVLSMK